MRVPTAARLRRLATLAAFAVGAAAGCYADDYLLGALCARDTDCGESQCCAGIHCRPEPDGCGIGTGWDAPYEFAYKNCDVDVECIAVGIPRCARWAGAEVGFCADLCVGGPSNCERYRNGAPLPPRTCVTIDAQSLCAVDCSGGTACPPDMQCREDVCVPLP